MCIYVDRKQQQTIYNMCKLGVEKYIESVECGDGY